MRYSMDGTLIYLQNGFSTICRLSFRLVLSRGQLKIRILQYTLGPIFGPFFAGVVYGASLTCCMPPPYGVIRRWQRLKCRWISWSWNYHSEFLPLKTTYGPKFVDVHTFSKKLKDVTGKTDIRRFCSCRRLSKVFYLCGMLLNNTYV